jgi:hypothetical protein
MISIGLVLRSSVIWYVHNRSFIAVIYGLYSKIEADELSRESTVLALPRFTTYLIRAVGSCTEGEIEHILRHRFQSGYPCGCGGCRKNKFSFLIFEYIKGQVVKPTRQCRNITVIAAKG